MKIKVVKVTVKGEISEVELDNLDVTKVQEEVGGYFDTRMTLDRKGFMVFDDEGLLKERDLNELATRYGRAKCGLMDPIVGDVIICGFDGVENMISAPADTVNLLEGMREGVN